MHTGCQWRFRAAPDVLRVPKVLLLLAGREPCKGDVINRWKAHISIAVLSGEAPRGWCRQYLSDGSTPRASRATRGFPDFHPPISSNVTVIAGDPDAAIETANTATSPPFNGLAQTCQSARTICWQPHAFGDDALQLPPAPCATYCTDDVVEFFTKYPGCPA